MQSAQGEDTARLSHGIDVAYDSMTGNTRRFSQQVAEIVRQQGLECQLHDLRRGEMPRRAYVLITHTFGRGEVPESSASFLKKHAEQMQAVVASGSFHWGELFGMAGEIISQEYGVPYISRINKSGNQQDVIKVAAWIVDRANRTGILN